MRRIQLEKWKDKIPDGNGGILETDITLVNLFTLLLNAIPPKNVPKGIEYFRIFARITEQFEKAKESGVLELEEQDYAFIKELVETDIPANWAVNPIIARNIEKFIGLTEIVTNGGM